MVHECKVKFLVARFQRGSLHLYSGFHQESLKQSASWQRKLAGIAVDPLLGGPSPFAPTTNELTSEGWKRAERTSKDRDCEGKGGMEWGGAFFPPPPLPLDNWRPSGTFSGCCSACASRQHEVEHQRTVRPSLIPRLCRFRRIRRVARQKVNWVCHSVIYLCIDWSCGSQLPHS